jgi:hypothetical protein
MMRSVQSSVSRWGLVSAIAGCLGLGCDNLGAQNAKPREYQVKAAYLVNFAKFAGWPKSVLHSAEAFPICILGNDPFGPDLNAALAGEAIDGLPLRAIRITSAEEVTGCRVLFISSSKEKQLKTILADLDNSGVLTVSDIPQFASRGGMIEFVLEGNRVRFEINLDAVARAGLSLSSELLRVAAVVRRDS